MTLRERIEEAERNAAATAYPEAVIVACEADLALLHALEWFSITPAWRDRIEANLTARYPGVEEPRVRVKQEPQMTDLCGSCRHLRIDHNDRPGAIPCLPLTIGRCDCTGFKEED